MMKKIFWQDPYLTELQTTVSSSNGNIITLNETIFYAFSGGQESDHGSIGGYTVLQAEKAGKDIRYTLPDHHDLQPHDPVTIIIDWERRYRLMRLHFAAEIILELTYRHFPTIEKIGAHIAQDKARIDFNWPQNIKTAFPDLLEQAQALIAANSKIISDFSDQEDERRYWKIEDFAQVACGGTHLRYTGEVGSIALNRKNIGKGKERIEIYLS